MFNRLVIFCVLIGLLCVPAFALGDSSADLRVSAGLFLITDSEASDTAGNGLSLNLEKKVQSLGEGDIYVSAGYIRFSNTYGSVDLDLSLIPIMATYVIKPSSDAETRFYFGGGAGLVFMDATASSGYYSDSGSETDFAYQLLGGAEFGDTMFAEVKYLSGGRTGNTGFSLHIGGRF